MRLIWLCVIKLVTRNTTEDTVAFSLKVQYHQLSRDKALESFLGVQTKLTGSEYEMRQHAYISSQRPRFLRTQMIPCRECISYTYMYVQEKNAQDLTSFPMTLLL